MATIERFEDLDAWKDARQLTRFVYSMSTDGAFARDFGLKDQMRRAAVSVLSNIAEGFESRTTQLFVEYLGRAKASCGELRAQAYVALDAGYVSEDASHQLVTACVTCAKRISRLIEYLTAHIKKHGNSLRELREGYAEDQPATWNLLTWNAPEES